MWWNWVRLQSLNEISLSNIFEQMSNIWLEERLGNAVNINKRLRITQTIKKLCFDKRSNFYVEKIFYKFFHRGLKVVIHSVYLNM